MRIKQKLVIILFTLFFSQNSLTAFSNFNTIALDTIPEVVQKYNGNRIKVKGIKINKQKGQSFKITYNLVNTGRNKIKLGKKRVPPSDLIIEFDSSLENNDLISAKAEIIENLKKQDISIRPGQLIMGSKLKFHYRPDPPTDRIAEVENQAPSNTEIDQTEVPTEKVSDEVVEIPTVETVETPTEVETTSTEKMEETILVKTEPSKKFNDSSIEYTDVEVEKEIIKETIVETPIIEKIDDIAIDSSTIDTHQPTAKQCPDLAVVNVEIAKKNKRHVTLKYTITNLGNVPIALLGETKKEEDNISIQVYFTRSEKLTRGAIPVKSFFIKKGLKNKGMLEPNSSYSGKIKVETIKLTKFTPVVAFSIDLNQDTIECTRDNNVSFVNITENAAPKYENLLPIQPLEATKDEVIGARN